MKRTILYFTVIFLTALSFTSCSDLPKINLPDSKVEKQNQEAVVLLKNMEILILKMDAGIRLWADRQSSADDNSKAEYKKMLTVDYPALKVKLDSASKGWSQESAAALKKELDINTSVFMLHDEIMKTLDSFDSYEKPENVFQVKAMIETDGDISIKTKESIAILESIMEELVVKI